MTIRRVVALWLAVSSSAVAQPAALPGVTGDHLIRNFRFASGEMLPELRLHYRTLGQPRRDPQGVVRNAVLVMHGTTGSGTQFLSPSFAGELYGAGQPLDTTRYYVILPDAIGHGLSSRPSEGLRARFPRYTYDDMVDADYRLLTEKLGVSHLRLVMGTSMGGMHSWVFAERYPDFMDGVVPLASVPAQIVGRNRMIRKSRSRGFSSRFRSSRRCTEGSVVLDRPHGALMVSFLSSRSGIEDERVCAIGRDRHHWRRLLLVS